MYPERGVKRLCASCGTRFYDLLAKPVCPKCRTEFIIPVPPPPRRIARPIPPPFEPSRIVPGSSDDVPELDEEENIASSDDEQPDDSRAAVQPDEA